MNSKHQLSLRTPSERVGTLAQVALPPPASPAAAEEQLLVRALRERDEGAFASLLDRYYSPMLRLAATYVRSLEEAEEVVQDTWLAVLGGLDRFEGRSSLKTWIFQILANRARTRAQRESRLLPFSALQRPGRPGDSQRDGLDPERLFQRGAAEPLFWHGQPWQPADPEEQLLAQELHGRIRGAIRTLPRRQQEVITLRDLKGWTPDEVCSRLEISNANQRVLLHRARLRVRAALEEYLAAPDADASPVPLGAA